MTVNVDAPNRDRIRPTQLRGQIRSGAVVVHPSSSPSSFAQGPQDEWDQKMKENYDQGGALKELVERGREDYRMGNTSRLP